MRILKKHTGMGLNSFSRGLQDGDPDAIVGMLVLTKRRRGEPTRWQDWDRFDLATLEQIQDETADPEAGDGDIIGGDDAGTPPAPVVAAAPTSTGGKTPKRASPAT